MQPILWNPDGAILRLGRAANQNRYGGAFVRCDEGTERAAVVETREFSAAKWSKEWLEADTYEEVSELLNELECISLVVAYMDMSMLKSAETEEFPSFFKQSYWIRVQLAACIFTIKEDANVPRMGFGRRFCTPHEKYPEIRTIQPSAEPSIFWVLGWYTLFL